MSGTKSNTDNEVYSPDADPDRISFLVWDKQSIRASGISKHIGASLHCIFTSPMKHPVLFLKTLQILRKEKPKIIICQSPPITCSFMALVYKYLFAGKPKPKIIIDAHTGAISRPGSKIVSKQIMKMASFIIVINKEQQDYLTQNYKVTPVVLEDPIPDFSDLLESGWTKPEEHKVKREPISNIAVISSFADDEPLEEMFEAASALPTMTFYVTGDVKHANKTLLEKKSKNIIITGFLDYISYIHLLQKVDVIMDLTTDKTSIIAGGFEAVALEKPLITSNWNPLKRYFYKGTVYADNTSTNIKDAIIKSLARKEDLSKEMRLLKIEKDKEWKDKISRLSYIFEK